MDILSDHIWYNGPTEFTEEQVRAQPDLFLHRGALFYTPTSSLPTELIGSGPLRVKLPVPTPDYLEFEELKGYAYPRLWVDLLQRNTDKIRWTPMCPARVTVTRFDVARLRNNHFVIGAKAVIDALKFKTTGRRDGRSLYYFGAIRDDSNTDAEFVFRQETVDSPDESGISIEVLELGERANAKPARADGRGQPG